MTHDPLCPCAPIDPIRPGSVHTSNSASCLCVLIAKVRAEERERSIEVIAALGPLSRFETCTTEDGYLFSGYVVVDVIPALREQP